MKVISDIKKGIEAYKKYKPKNYAYLKKHINIEEYTFSIAKIESNFKPKAVSKDGYSTFGLYQLLNSVLNNTIKSYTKKVTAVRKLYFKSSISQTFVFLQLTYLNLKYLESKNFLLNNEYQEVVNALMLRFKDKKIITEIQLAYLHNQGTSATIRQAKNYNVSVFYLPNFLGVRNWLKQMTIKNISSATIIEFNILSRMKNISINELSKDFIKFSKYLKPVLIKQIPKIKALTKSAFKGGLLTRLTFLGLLLTPTTTGAGADRKPGSSKPFEPLDTTPSKPTETTKEKVEDKVKDKTQAPPKEVEDQKEQTKKENEKKEEEKKTGKTYAGGNLDQIKKIRELGIYGLLLFLFLKRNEWQKKCY